MGCCDRDIKDFAFLTGEDGEPRLKQEHFEEVMGSRSARMEFDGILGILDNSLLPLQILAASQTSLAGREYTAHWEGGKVSVKAWRPRSLSRMSTPCCMETVGGTMTLGHAKVTEDLRKPTTSRVLSCQVLLDLSRGGSLPCPSIGVSLQEYDRALIQAHCFEDGWDLSWWATTREFSVKWFCWKQAVLGSRPTKITSKHQLFSVLLDNPLGMCDV